MAEVIKMPRMSDTMTEGVIVAWHKKVGDKVKSGELLAEIETDKAVMEFESFQDGVLLYIGAETGKALPVDSVIAVLGKEGEDYHPALEAAGKPSVPAAPAAAAPAPAVAAAAVPAAPATPATPATPAESLAQGPNRLKASPLARKIAADTGVDLQRLKGTGDEGRIVKKDVEQAALSPAASPAVPAAPAFVPNGTESFEEVPLSQMRKTIARRLAESMFGAPHFYLGMEMNMDRSMEARKQIADQLGIKFSFNDLVIKACAMALRKHPKVNSSWLGDRIRYNHHVHIGMAVAVEEGLLVPVIRFADQKSLSQINAEARTFAQKAKEKKLQPSDWEGNTFTISNLGMMDIDEFTAIINPPDACILAVGKIRETAGVVNGSVGITHLMKVTLSCDHRAVDGATGAAFLQTLKGFLENPVAMLV